MRRPPFTLLLGLAASVHAAPAPTPAPRVAAPEMTALSALKMLPKTAMENIALIEGYDGQPGPTRWNVLVYDAKAPQGVREYVIAGGELIASRTVSQFAETLRPVDVLDLPAVSVDSDRVMKLAQEYAKANALAVGTFNYELKKDGEGAVPLWRVSYVGAKGQPLALLVVTATKGFVVSHEGLAADPGASTPAPKPRPEPEPPHRVAAETHKAAPPRVREREREPEPIAVAPPLPVPAPPPEEENRPGLLRRASGSIQRIFTR